MYSARFCALFLFFSCLAPGIPVAQAQHARTSERSIIRLQKALRSPNSATRRTAALALGELGAAAKPAIPALIQAMTGKDDHISLAAAAALGKVGPDAVAPVLATLTDSRMRRFAAVVILTVGAKAVPSLRHLLNDGRQPHEIRAWAARTLGAIGSGAQAAIPDLIRIVQHEPGDLYLLAASIIRQLRRFDTDRILSREGDTKASALFTLTEGLKGNIADVRQSAIDALSEIGRPAIPAMIQVLRASDAAGFDPINQEDQTGFEELFGRIWSRMEPDSVPSLYNVIENKKESITVRKTAIAALANMEIDRSQAVQHLLALIADRTEDDFVRLQALDAIASIGRSDTTPSSLIDSQATFSALQADEILRVVRSILMAPETTKPFSDEIVESSLRLLGSLGTVARPAASQFVAVLRDHEHSKFTRIAAAEGLPVIGAESLSVYSDLLPVITDSQEDSDIRVATIEALIHLRLRRADVVRTVREIFNNKQEAVPVREAAAAAWLSASDVEICMSVITQDSMISISNVASKLNGVWPSRDEDLPSLLRILKAKDNPIQRRTLAMLLLRSDKHHSDTIMPSLLDIATDRTEPTELRRQAIGDLEFLQLDNPISHSRLLPILEDKAEDPLIRTEIILLLDKVTQDQSATQMLRTLTKILQDKAENPDVQYAAAAHLGDFNRNEPEVRALLLAILKSPEGADPLRQTAAASIAEGDPDALSLLLAIMRDHRADNRVREAAAFGLGQMEPEVLLRLLPIFQQERGDDQLLAAHAILALLLNYDRWKQVGLPICSGGDSIPSESILFSRYGRDLLLPPWSAEMPFYGRQRSAIGKDTESLESVFERLTAALRNSRYRIATVLEGSDFFAIASGLERINKDGVPFLQNRWSTDKIPLRSANLWGYLRRLIFGEPAGYFRMVIFVVTSQAIRGSGTALTFEQASHLPPADLGQLHKPLHDRRFRDANCYLVVYGFEKTGDNVQPYVDLDAETQYATTGIASHLGEK